MGSAHLGEIHHTSHLAPVHQRISAVALHAFSDASKSGVLSAVYAVVQQGEVKTQGL